LIFGLSGVFLRFFVDAGVVEGLRLADG
jgi:hypothetical protein